MAQQVWTFKDNFGIEHSFGIYHGEESGHFMGYLDNNIILTDFNILDSKDYHFFINQLMMTFSIEKSGESFNYKLFQDTETDTPHNRHLKQDKKTSNFVIFALVILFLIALKIGVRVFLHFKLGH